MKFPESNTLKVYAGLGLCLIFSIFFLAVLVRATMRKEALNFRILMVVAFAILATVTLVGDAPYVSLIQSVILSLGCLLALYHHITKGEDPPNARIVSLLVITMMACLLINQASDRLQFGLLKWFNVDVSGLRGNTDSSAALSNQLATIERDLASNGAQLVTVKSTFEARFSNLTSTIQTVTNEVDVGRRVAAQLQTEVQRATKQLDHYDVKFATLQNSGTEFSNQVRVLRSQFPFQLISLSNDLRKIMAAVQQISDQSGRTDTVSPATESRGSPTVRPADAAAKTDVRILRAGDEFELSPGEIRAFFSQEQVLCYQLVENHGLLSSGSNKILKSFNSRSGDICFEQEIRSGDIISSEIPTSGTLKRKKFRILVIDFAGTNGCPRLKLFDNPK